MCVDSASGYGETGESVKRVTLPLWGLAALGVLLVLANLFDNARVRRQAKIAVGDSLARVQSHALDSAVAVYRGDSVRFTNRIASLERAGQRVRVVTVARVDTLREALPDTLRPILDSIVHGFTAQLAAKDSALSLTALRLAQAETLLGESQKATKAWETQASRWRREARRWTLRLGPFSLRPCVGYGLTASGSSVFAGACLTP